MQVQGWWTDSVPTSRGSLRICLMTTPWHNTFTTVTLRTRGTVVLYMHSPEDAEETVYWIVFSSQRWGGFQSHVWVDGLGQEADGSACSSAAPVYARQHIVRHAVLGGPIHWKDSRSDQRQKPHQHHGEKWMRLQCRTLFKFIGWKYDKWHRITGFSLYSWSKMLPITSTPISQKSSTE